MRLYGARNDKAHQAFMVGLDAACGEPYAKDGIQRVVDSSGLTETCQHSHTLYPSACLVGETTRRHGLNLDRGGQPQDAQRVAGKREWHRETGKCSPQRMAPSVIKPHDPIEAFLRLNRADSPSVIYLYRG
jgi:hypothetical protein